jgi:hypothetical protein
VKIIRILGLGSYFLGAIVIQGVIVIYLLFKKSHIYFLTGFVMELRVLLFGFNILHSYFGIVQGTQNPKVTSQNTTCVLGKPRIQSNIDFTLWTVTKNEQMSVVACLACIIGVEVKKSQQCFRIECNQLIT